MQTLILISTLLLGVLPSTTPRVEYTASGKTYSFSFKTLSTTHVKVYQNSVLQTSGYAVTLNANQDSSPGGTVTFVATPPLNAKVRIERVLPVTQESVWTSFSRAKSLELDLDRRAMVDQQMNLVQSDAMNLATTASSLASQAATDARAAIAAAQAAANAVAQGAVGGNSTLVTTSGADTARTLAAHFATVINVRDFGAVGDYSTNDYNAIVAANAASIAQYKPLYFPAGAYKIEPPVGGGSCGIAWQGHYFSDNGRYQTATLYPINCTLYDTSDNDAEMHPHNRTSFRNLRVDASAIVSDIPVFKIHTTYSVDLDGIFIDGYARASKVVDIDTAHDIVINRLIAGGNGAVGSIAVSIDTAQVTMKDYDLEGWQIGIQTTGGIQTNQTQLTVFGGYNEANSWSINLSHGTYGSATIVGTHFRLVNAAHGVRIYAPNSHIVAPTCEGQGAGGYCVVADVIKGHAGQLHGSSVFGVRSEQLLDTFNVLTVLPKWNDETYRNTSYVKDLGTLAAGVLKKVGTVYLGFGEYVTGKLKFSLYNSNGFLVSRGYDVVMSRPSDIGMQGAFTPEFATTLNGGSATFDVSFATSAAGGEIEIDATLANTTAVGLVEFEYTGGKSTSVY